MAKFLIIGATGVVGRATIFNINVFVIYMTQVALPLLQASQGNIINISSTIADRPMANMSVYSASKAAVWALTVS